MSTGRRSAVTQLIGRAISGCQWLAEVLHRAGERLVVVLARGAHHAAVTGVPVGFARIQRAGRKASSAHLRRRQSGEDVERRRADLAGDLFQGSAAGPLHSETTLNV